MHNNNENECNIYGDGRYDGFQQPPSLGDHIDMLLLMKDINLLKDKIVKTSQLPKCKKISHHLHEQDHGREVLANKVPYSRTIEGTGPQHQQVESTANQLQHATRQAEAT